MYSCEYDVCDVTLECISTPGKCEKYAWPRWESNLRPVISDYCTITSLQTELAMQYISQMDNKQVGQMYENWKNPKSRKM